MNSEKYFCKTCGSEETIVDYEDGIRLSEITGLFCPVCLAKGKHHKMYKIIENCTKLNSKGGNKQNANTK